MGKQKKGDRLDASRFQSPGINYKGKLIGLEDVTGPQGDMMCQVAMAKAKAAVKTIGEHKLKIVLNISLDGIRIVEEKSESILYFHPVNRISFISRDPGDSRAFGYVYGREDGSHQFYGIKTEKVAENAVLNLRDLFQIVYEMKKQEKEELQDSFEHDSQSTSSTVVKGPNARNGLEQLNEYSSSISMLSSSHKASSWKKDSPPSPSHDRSVVGTSQSGFQRGIAQHRSSGIKQSFMAGKRSHLAARQYASMTASERHKLQPSVTGSSTPHQQSTSESTKTRTSPLAKSQHLHSSVQSCDWFPPEDSGDSLARQTAGPDASPVDETSGEGWAVFETGEQSSSVLTGATGCGIIEGVTAETGGENAEGTRIQVSELPQHSGETCVDSEVEKFSVDSGRIIAVEVKKVPFPRTSNTSISGSENASESPVDVVNCTFYSHLECSSLSPKLPGIPKLASSESLSDQVAEKEEEDGTENSTSVAEFPSPDAPPPPLPLDVVVDRALQPPVVPPRPPVFEFASSRRDTELTESPIYGNISAPESASFSSFTLPRPRPMPSNRDLVSSRVKPIQAGYDLTMPRPRPDPNLTDLRPRDDPALNESRTFACHRLVRGETLSACQNEERSEITFQNPRSAKPQRSRVEESTNTASANRNVHSDPFAICLLSKGAKPHTVVSMSSAASDCLIHTSIAPIPRPRPRQRSVPGASRDGGASVASTSESPMRSAADTSSPLQNSVTDDVIRLNHKHLDHSLPESHRSEPSGNCPSQSGRRSTESLSSNVAKVPIRVHKESLGSNYSSMTPDPFVEVDPFAMDSFSDDPFSLQPDPFSFESPSSDPFSREFPSKAPLFYTRVVTVETGEVFDDTASSCESDKRTAPESIAVRVSVRVSSSDSAMEQKAVILLEKASGDSAAVESERPDLHSTADQRSQKHVPSLRRDDDPTVCGGSGNVIWENDANVDARRQISASGTHTTPITKEQLATEMNTCLIKSEREEIKPFYSTSQADVAGGFSDSFNPISFSLDTDLIAALPSQVDHSL